MHFEEAFSLQFGETVTAEHAYELFWAGLIDDKRAFQCPGEECSAQITCANLDVIEQDLKVQPHYRLYGQHATECSFARDRASGTAQMAGTSGRPLSATEKDRPDIFHLKRPVNHFVRTTGSLSSAWIGIKKQKSKTSGSRGSEKARQRNYYSVGYLVSRWIRLREEKELADTQVQIGSAIMTYEQLFRGIYNQNARDLENAIHVYWGKAWAERLANNTGYRIRFNEKLAVDRQPCRPSLLIYDDKIKEYELKKLLISRLDAAIEKSKGACILFVLGVPVVVPDVASATASEPYTRSFVNFKAPSLDMLEIRGLDLFEQLRRSA